LKFFHTLTRNPTFRTRIVPLIISLTLLFSVLIIAVTPPATGYELSIFGAYPDFLWILISINIFFSMYTIFCDNQSRNLYYGYFSILLIEIIILFLPIMRGYYSMSRGGGDVYHHMFVASQILNTGYLPITDFYPVMHVWLSFVYHFLPDFILLTLLLSIVFFILYILSLYILGKIILDTKKGGIFFSILGIPLIFSYGYYAFYPFLFALFIFPLILYAYHKITHDPLQKSFFYICLVFLSIFIVFCHPMISVFLIIMFSIFTFFELFKGWATGWRSNVDAANIAIIVSLTLVLWWLQFRSIVNSLQKMSSALFGVGSHVSIIDYNVDVISTSKVSVWQVIELFIKYYGSICLYFLISLVFLVYLIYQFYQNKEISAGDFMYSLQFCVALFIGIALLTGYFVIFEPLRAAMYGLILATILCGLFLYRISLSESKQRQLGFCALIIPLMTIVCMLAVLAIYQSPWTSTPNSAMTYGDKNGIDWILEYRNAAVPIVRDESTMEKYKNYYYASTNARTDEKFVEYRDIPSDFGYFTNRTMGTSFAYLRDKNVYLITTEKLRLAPLALPVDRRIRAKWYTDSDFIRLRNDPSVNTIYSNDGFGVWNVHIR